MKPLNKEILRLSIPSILANLTVPLVGFVDTAVAGHLHGGEAAAFIGAISIGAMLFNLLYWNFAFLRTGTGGLTAQAFGRADMHECARILARGLELSGIIALTLWLLQWPFLKLALLCVQATPEVEELASQYFLIRIWAAPATLGMMAFSGWFVGMQDSVSSMWKDLTVNGVNIVASIILSLGIGSWKGMGFVGVAWGTVIAQYSGLLFCITVSVFKYGRKVFSHFPAREWAGVLKGSDLKQYFRMNADLFGRSIFFTFIYIGYTLIAAEFGDLMLACSAIMMQILMIFSYFTDGFAYAGEALTGRFIGERNPEKMRESIRLTFIWSMGIAVAFIFIYMGCGTPLLRLLTDDGEVVDACRAFLPWLILMPPLGCAAFTWDGIYLGATASRGIRDAMMGAAASFFAVWFVGKWLLHPEGSAAIHLLLGAYFAHLAFRTVWLTAAYRKSILTRFTSSPERTDRPATGDGPDSQCPGQ